MNGVVTDKAFDQGRSVYAVIWKDDLLPVRFAKEWQAHEHLESLKRGHVYRPLDTTESAP